MAINCEKYPSPAAHTALDTSDNFIYFFEILSTPDQFITSIFIY